MICPSADLQQVKDSKSHLFKGLHGSSLEGKCYKDLGGGFPNCWRGIICRHDNSWQDVCVRLHCGFPGGSFNAALANAQIIVRILAAHEGDFQ